MTENSPRLFKQNTDGLNYILSDGMCVYIHAGGKIIYIDDSLESELVVDVFAPERVHKTVQTS